MTISRRHIFPLAGLAAISIVPSEAKTPATSDQGMALGISIRNVYNGWEVLVPALEYAENWRPGMAIPNKWIALGDFLAEVEKECGIVSA